MKNLLIIITICYFFSSCNEQNEHHAVAKIAEVSDTSRPHKEKVLYKSPTLIINQLSPSVFRHISYLNTESFGKVACNGMIVIKNKEAALFDTPAGDSGSLELLSWLRDSMHCRLTAVVATHFHSDCLGGLSVFQKNSIPSYANYKTIELAKQKGFPVPSHGFHDSTSFKVGDITVMSKFLGQGHTRDNIVAYVPQEKILFGGCLVKEINASKGNLEDANVEAWPNTIKRLKKEFPEARAVIPGHGEPGGPELLDYTEELFSK